MSGCQPSLPFLVMSSPLLRLVANDDAEIFEIFRNSTVESARLAIHLVVGNLDLTCVLIEVHMVVHVFPLHFRSRLPT